MKNCNHSFAGGYCVHCMKKQPTIRNGVEVGLSSVSSNRIAYKPPQARKKNITSEFQYTVDELITYLKEDQKHFGKYCGIVKRVGMPKARQWIKEMKGRGITNPAYFMTIYKNHNQLKKNERIRQTIR